MKAGDYRRAFRDGLRVDGSLFTVVLRRNELGVSRLGLAVSRRVGPAVARNRAKRLLREAFRCDEALRNLGVDVVVVAKARIVEHGQRDVGRELRNLVKRGLGRTQRAEPRPAARD